MFHSLSNNRLTSSNRQQMVKLFEERDYAPENPSRVESQPAAFVRKPPICVTRVRKMTRLSRSERDEMEGGKSQDEEDSKYEDEDDDSSSSGRFDRNNFLDEDQPKKFII